MMLAVAFVPTAEVQEHFEILKYELPHTRHEISEYFWITYITGQPRRGRKRAVDGTA